MKILDISLSSVESGIHRELSIRNTNWRKVNEYIESLIRENYCNLTRRQIMLKSGSRSWLKPYVQKSVSKKSH